MALIMKYLFHLYESIAHWPYSSPMMYVCMKGSLLETHLSKSWWTGCISNLEGNLFSIELTQMCTAARHECITYGDIEIQMTRRVTIDLG